jgi:hypothetical protein
VAGADNVGGDQIGAELDAGHRQAGRAGQGVGHRRLTGAGHVLEDQMAFGQQTEDAEEQDLVWHVHDQLQVGVDAADDLGHAGRVEVELGLGSRCRGCGRRHTTNLARAPAWARRSS